jgi:hypothetical protein
MRTLIVFTVGLLVGMFLVFESSILVRLKDGETGAVASASVCRLVHTVFTQPQAARRFARSLCSRTHCSHFRPARVSHRSRLLAQCALLRIWAPVPLRLRVPCSIVMV